MKKITLLLFMSLIAVFTMAQTTIFTDDFESYTAGQSLASQTTNWTTWSDAPGGSEDAMVSDAQFNGGAQSLNVVAGNDMIYDFGNKTSGIYQVEFYYYVPTGSEAYFNFQHIFGSEWAFSCTYAAGTVTLANGETTSPTTTYTEDTWMHYVIDVDLGNDQAVLTIDDVEFATWTFSNEETATAGTLQLGCVNFYGPTGNSYFVDDFTYTEVESGMTPADIDITVTPITTDGNNNETVSFSNTGEEDLAYRAYATYNEPDITIDKAMRDGVMNYDGDNANSIGWGSSFDVFVATRFMPDLVSQFVGQEITSVDIYIGALPTDGEIVVYVWDKGGFAMPGGTTILGQETFAVTADSWNTIALTTPIQLDGDEIWVGYEFTTIASTYTLGVDGESIISGTNYIRTTPAWSEFTGIDGVGNLNIRANVVGTGWPEWMTFTPTDGSVAPAATEDVSVGFEVDGLENGQYTGTIIIGCNDYENEWTEIPVTMDFFVGIENAQNVAIMTYPNPVSDIFTIRSDENILNYEIYSINGQLIDNQEVNSLNINVDMSEYAGMYILKINTDSKTITRRIVVE